MAEEHRHVATGSGEAAPAADPGSVSRLLLEIARLPDQDAAASWRKPVLPGDLVGRYEIRREIGRGGFGAVYEAFDPQLGRTVALKALKPGRSRHLFEESIQKEAEAVAKLDHPAIVTIFDVGTCPAGAYLVMELLQGETLASRMAKGPLPVDEALRIAEQMAEGLAHAHSRGVLHRDLKPANVFVCEDDRVKLLDFGLAHLLGTEGASRAGTPAYMAPEQATGAAVDERADVWAAGMVLGEMLTGKRPVERTPTPKDRGEVSRDLAAARQQAEQATAATELMWKAPRVAPQASAATPRPKLAGVPRPVAKAVGAALAEDPAARPRDGKAWLAELRSARLRVDRPRRIRRLALVGTAFLLLGLAVAGFATWRIWRRQFPIGRVTVAVADVANETGDTDLDALSGLLITSLEQSRNLAVVTRGRMLDLAAQAGLRHFSRIDEQIGRDIARRADADVLLVPAAHRIGGTIAVELRGIDPLHDRYVFTLRDEVAAKSGLLGAIDRLSDRARRTLQEPAAAVDADRIRVGNAVSSSLEAYQHYASGMDLLYRQGDTVSAVAALRRAVEIDPEFAAANLELASWDLPSSEGNRGVLRNPPSRVEPFWTRAMEGADRMPAKERLWVKLAGAIYGDQVVPSPGEGERIANELVERFPDDKNSLHKAAEAYLALAAAQTASGDRERMRSSAMRTLQRVLALDPGHHQAAMVAVRLEQGAGNGVRGLELAKAALAARDTVSAHGLLAYALAFTHECEGALRHVAEATARGREGSWLVTLFSSSALVACGRFGEAEREVLRLLSVIGDRDPRSTLRANVRLIGLQALQGHCAAAQQTAEATISRATWYPATRANLLACGHDRLSALRARAYVRSLEDGGDRGNHATVAASFGEFEVARGLAHHLRSGSRAELRYLAFVAAHEERWNDAVAMQRQIFERWGRPGETPHELAAVFFAMGRLDEAISALGGIDTELAHASPDQDGIQWSRSLMLRARAREQRGDLTGARADADQLLKLWATADPDLPLLLEAKAMRERLEAAPGRASSPR